MSKPNHLEEVIHPIHYSPYTNDCEASQKASRIVLRFEFLYFEFVSDFDIRISNFFLSHLEKNHILESMSSRFLEFFYHRILVFLNTLFLPNEPNFRTRQIAASAFSKTGYCSLMTENCQKNEPKRTQFPQHPQAYLKMTNEPNFDARLKNKIKT